MSYMNERISRLIALLLLFTTMPSGTFAQGDAKVSARADAQKISVGDRVRVFLEVQHDPLKGKLQWAFIPDTFNHLEVVDKGKIDTSRNGALNVYKQKLELTGFDSGLFVIPSFAFTIIPNQGTTTSLLTDSFPLLVQTVAVDTTQPFKPIKGIIAVKGSWKDYLPWIIGGIAGLIVLAFLVWYFLLRRKKPAPVAVKAEPRETIQQRALRLLAELEQEQLWQSGRVKEYYVRLTEIVRGYIETRFNTAAMELTTDELLDKASRLPALLPFRNLLSIVLRTADLAKFAKAEPLPQEHLDAMSLSRQLIQDSTPVIAQPENDKPS